MYVIQAISNNELNKVQQWLKENPHEINNALTKDGETALHLAAKQNNLKIAQLLLNSHAGILLLY